MAPGGEGLQIVPRGQGLGKRTHAVCRRVRQHAGAPPLPLLPTCSNFPGEDRAPSMTSMPYQNTSRPRVWDCGGQQRRGRERREGAGQGGCQVARQGGKGVSQTPARLATCRQQPCYVYKTVRNTHSQPRKLVPHASLVMHWQSVPPHVTGPNPHKPNPLPLAAPPRCCGLLSIQTCLALGLPGWSASTAATLPLRTFM